MSEKKVTVNLSWLSLLGLLFVGLKLTGHIGWSWWWVLLPFYGPWIVVLLLAAVAVLVVARK